MKKFIIFAAAFLFSFNVQAKIINVEAQGVGDDYDWAVMNAVENAVRQSSEVIVHRDAPMEKFEMVGQNKDQYASNTEIKAEKGSLWGGVKHFFVKDEGKQSGEMKARYENKSIDAHYAGKIDSYQVLSSEEKGGKYYVKISAKVIKADDYKSPGLVKKADYSLSVQPFKVGSGYAWLVGVSEPEVVTKLQTALINRLSMTRKFNLVSRIDLGDYLDEVSLEALNLTKEENQNKIQQIKSADYLLVGSIDYLKVSSKTSSVEMTGESYSSSKAQLQITYRLIETGTMEIVASGMVDSKYAKNSGKVKTETALSYLFSNAADKIVDQLLQDIYPDYQPVFEKAATEHAKAKKAEKKAKAKKAATPKKRQVVKLPFDK